MSSETPSFVRDCDELTATVKLLSEVVEEACKQIKILKEERAGSTGEVKDAYTLVIRNKVWLLQQVIGKFWRESLTLEIEADSPTDLKEYFDAVDAEDKSETASNAAVEGGV